MERRHFLTVAIAAAIPTVAGCTSDDDANGDAEDENGDAEDEDGNGGAEGENGDEGREESIDLDTSEVEGREPGDDLTEFHGLSIEAFDHGPGETEIGGETVESGYELTGTVTNDGEYAFENVFVQTRFFHEIDEDEESDPDYGEYTLADNNIDGVGEVDPGESVEFAVDIPDDPEEFARWDVAVWGNAVATE